MSRDDDDEAEQLSPRVVHNHYEQSKSVNGNGNGLASKLNTIMLVALLGIAGFLWATQWGMNERLARVEANMETLLARP